jgi:hypothetical protein
MQPARRGRPAAGEPEGSAARAVCPALPAACMARAAALMRCRAPPPPPARSPVVFNRNRAWPIACHEQRAEHPKCVEVDVGCRAGLGVGQGQAGWGEAGFGAGEGRWSKGRSRWRMRWGIVSVACASTGPAPAATSKTSQPRAGAQRARLRRAARRPDARARAPVRWSNVGWGTPYFLNSETMLSERMNSLCKLMEGLSWLPSISRPLGEGGIVVWGRVRQVGSGWGGVGWVGVGCDKLRTGGVRGGAPTTASCRLRIEARAAGRRRRPIPPAAALRPPGAGRAPAPQLCRARPAPAPPRPLLTSSPSCEGSGCCTRCRPPYQTRRTSCLWCRCS